MYRVATAGKVLVITSRHRTAVRTQDKDMNKLLAHSAITLALATAALAVQAAPLTHNGFANGSVNVTVGKTNANTDVNASAGAFSVTWGGEAFVTYCVELTQFAKIGQTHEYTLVEGASYFDTNFAPALGVSGATIVERLGGLFTFLGGISTPVSAADSAAVQLAVWELMYEPAGTMTLTAGQFKESRSGNTSLRAAADALLVGALGVQQVAYTIDVLKNASFQDYLVIRPIEDSSTGQGVPTPATLALVALGLVGIGVVRRRRAG
jgi:MYXO-CTERM domain-containing protein